MHRYTSTNEKKRSAWRGTRRAIVWATVVLVVLVLAGTIAWHVSAPDRADFAGIMMAHRANDALATFQGLLKCEKYLEERPSGWFTRQVRKKLAGFESRMRAWSEQFRRDFWERVQKGPTPSDFAVLTNVMDYFNSAEGEDARLRIAVLSKLRDLDLFLQVPNNDWSDFALRHGRLPITAGEVRVQILFEHEETALESASYIRTAGRGSLRKDLVRLRSTGRLVVVKDGKELQRTEAYTRDDPPLPDELTVWHEADMPTDDRLAVVPYGGSAYGVKQHFIKCMVPEIRTRYAPIESIHIPLYGCDDKEGRDREAFLRAYGEVLTVENPLMMKELRAFIKGFPRSRFILDLFPNADLAPDANGLVPLKVTVKPGLNCATATEVTVEPPEVVAYVLKSELESCPTVRRCVRATLEFSREPPNEHVERKVQLTEALGGPDGRIRAHFYPVYVKVKAKLDLKTVKKSLGRFPILAAGPAEILSRYTIVFQSEQGEAENEQWVDLEVQGLPSDIEDVNLQDIRVQVILCEDSRPAESGMWIPSQPVVVGLPPDVWLVKELPTINFNLEERNNTSPVP